MNPGSILAVWVAAAGLIAGSFLNVVVYRLPRGRSVVSPPSQCPQCKSRLNAVDLIPVVGFFIRQGHCRHCGHPISWRYPLGELGYATLVLASWYGTGSISAFATVAVAGFLLVAAAWIDLEHRVIPNRLMLAGAVAAGLLMAAGWLPWRDGLWGGLVAGGFFLLVAVLSGGGMGGGDVKLAAVGGLFVGLEGAVVAVLIAVVTGGMAGLFLLLLKLKTRRDMIPFGPFIAIGVFSALWLSNGWVTI